MLGFINFAFNYQPNKFSLEGNFLRIFFDRNKKRSLQVKLTTSTTFNDILELKKNEIIKLIPEINQNNEKNMYCFILVDEENPMIEFKIKLSDYPMKILKNKKWNVYYLNMYNEVESETNEIKQAKENNEVKIEGNESIREGEIQKYSNKTKKFKKKKMNLHNDKIILYDKTKKKTKQISLVDIKFIGKVNFLKEKFAFEIQMFDHEKYIFSSKTSSDLQSWIETIISQKILVFDNKNINDLNLLINKNLKEIYEKEKKLCDLAPILKEMIKIQELREILLNFINDEIVSLIVLNYFEYKYSFNQRNNKKINEIVTIMTQIIFKIQNIFEELIFTDRFTDEPKISGLICNSIPTSSKIWKDNILARTTLYSKNKRKTKSQLSGTNEINSPSSIMNNLNQDTKKNTEESESTQPKLFVKSDISKDDFCKINEIEMNENVSVDSKSVANDYVNLSIKTLSTTVNLTFQQKIFLFCPFSTYNTLKLINEDHGFLIEKPFHEQSQIILSRSQNKNEIAPKFKRELFDDIFKRVLKYIQKFYFEDFLNKNKSIVESILILIWKSKNGKQNENLIKLRMPLKQKSDNKLRPLTAEEKLDIFTSNEFEN